MESNNNNHVNSSEFVFIWKIERFKRFNSYTSPEFFADTLDRTKWKLKTNYYSFNNISIKICREDEGTEIELDSYISCFKASGETVWLGEKETFKIKQFSEYTFLQNYPCNEICYEDEIVIHCKLRQRNTNLSEWGYCYARTTCSHVVKKWNVTTSIGYDDRSSQTLPLKSGSDTDPILTLTAFSANNSSSFHFFIDTNEDQFSRIEICNLETKKKRSLPKRFFKGKQYDFPNFILKHPPRKLTLSCKYTCFDMEIDTIEIMSGMFAEHKAFFKCPFNPQNTGNESENQEDSSVESNRPFSLSEDLLHYFSEGKFSDLTLTVEDRSFPVHKSLLCARAYEFRDLLKGPSSESGRVLLLTDIDASTLELFLSFLYSDRMGMIDSNEEVVKLYYAAIKYGFEALKKKCLALLEDFQVTISNVCLVLKLSEGLTDDALRKKSLNFFSENAKMVMEGDSWIGFMEHAPQQAAHLMHKFILSLNDSSVSRG